MNEFIQLYGESAKTALGFFWKAGWAFVLGYFVSGMIQAFVPKGKLTRYMGEADLKVSLFQPFLERPLHPALLRPLQLPGH